MIVLAHKGLDKNLPLAGRKNTQEAGREVIRSGHICRDKASSGIGLAQGLHLLIGFWTKRENLNTKSPHNGYQVEGFFQALCVLIH